MLRAKKFRFFQGIPRVDVPFLSFPFDATPPTQPKKKRMPRSAAWFLRRLWFLKAMESVQGTLQDARCLSCTKDPAPQNYVATDILSGC